MFEGYRGNHFFYYFVSVCSCAKIKHLIDKNYAEYIEVHCILICSKTSLSAMYLNMYFSSYLESKTCCTYEVDHSYYKEQNLSLCINNQGIFLICY